MIKYEALIARGDRCGNMMSNLFNGYLAAGDKGFVIYIQHLNDKYDERDNIYKDKLMMLALKKYKNMCTKDKWLSNSPE